MSKIKMPVIDFYAKYEKNLSKNRDKDALAANKKIKTLLSDTLKIISDTRENRYYNTEAKSRIIKEIVSNSITEAAKIRDQMSTHFNEIENSLICRIHGPSEKVSELQTMLNFLNMRKFKKHIRERYGNDILKLVSSRLPKDKEALKFIMQNPINSKKENVQDLKNVALEDQYLQAKNPVLFSQLKSIREDKRNAMTVLYASIVYLKGFLNESHMSST
jgi:hypothetical protein